MVEVIKGCPKSYVPFLRQCFVTASVAINIVGHGCVIGFSAVLIPSLRLPESHIHATPAEESWIASIIGFALIIGNIISTLIMDRLGRKKSHLLTIIPTILGWFLITLVNNVSGLITARLFQGIAMGILGPLGSIIIGEMTDPKNRGPFLTSVSLSLTVGVLFSHTVGSILSWQITATICSFITFISLILIIFTPESPHWLIAKGRFDEAKVVFFWLRGQGEEQEMELQNMIIAQEMMRKSSITDQKLTVTERIKRFFKYVRRTIRKPQFYKPIIIMLHMYTMFQFAGINVLSSYATDIIKNVVGPDAKAELLMVALDVERFICNILTVFLMKIVKRRTLLVSSVTVCILSYLGKGAYVYGKHHNLLPFDSPWIPIGLIGIYMASITIASSIPFAISGEIFALEYRGLGGGISVLALSLNFFVAVKCFPLLIGAIGLTLTYCLYAGVVMYCLLVTWAMLPETKDKTLQEIENSFIGASERDFKSIEPLNGARSMMMRRCSSQIIY